MLPRLMLVPVSEGYINHSCHMGCHVYLLYTQLEGWFYFINRRKYILYVLRKKYTELPSFFPFFTEGGSRSSQSASEPQKT